MEKEIIEKNEELKFIKEVRIEKFWNKEDIEWKLNSDVNILAGDNGTGKSTVLQLIYGTIKQKFQKLYLSKISKAVVVSFNIPLQGKVEELRYWHVITFVDTNTVLEMIENNIKQFPDEHRSYIVDNIKNSKKGAFLTESNLYVPDSDIFKYDNKDFNIRIDEIKTVDSLLLDRETIQKISNEEVLTDLDWKVSRLEIEYKDYQIDIGKRIINALKKGEKRSEVTKISETQTLFYDLIDQLFAHTEKTIDRESNDILFRDKDNKEIIPYRLSSGEKHMIIILLTALVQDNKHAIMIMDEPEISLHTDWQKNLISNIRKLNPNVQLIIATHSPAIVMNGWQDKIFQIDDLIVKSEENKIEEVNQEAN